MSETFRLTFPSIPVPPPTKLSYGLPFYDACAKHVHETFVSKRVYIIVSKTLSEKTNYLNDLEKALGLSTIAGVWTGIPSHTPADSLIPVIHDARAKNADCIVTLGGGSITDGAKVIALALANGVNTLEDLYALPRIGTTYDVATGSGKGPTIPLICIPITLSGGEYSNFAGVTHPVTRFKDQFTHQELFLSLIILDPAITVSTPMWVWLCTGVRSIDHCVECYLAVNATEQGDIAAKEGLIQLVDGLLKIMISDDKSDLDSRLQCQLGSNASLTMLQLGAMAGASHGVGHQLGAMGVAHGHTSCILLPAVCKYNIQFNKEKQSQLKDVLLALPSVEALIPEKERAQLDLGDVSRIVFDALGMPKSLREVGFPEAKLPALAKNCLNEVFVHSNPRPMKSVEDVMQLLDMVRD